MRKAVAALDKCKQEGEIIVRAKETGKTLDGENYSEDDYKSDMVKQTARTAWNVGKYYIPTVLLGVTAAACSMGALGIANKRLASVTAFATATAGAFSSYRNNVVKISGKEMDTAYLTGQAPKALTGEVVLQDEILDEDGKVIEAAITDTVECFCIDEAVETAPNGSSIAFSPFTIKLDNRHPMVTSCNGNPFYMAPFVDAKIKECNTWLARHKYIDMYKILDIFGITESMPEYRNDINFQAAKMCKIFNTERYYDIAKREWIDTPNYIPGQNKEVAINNFSDALLAIGDETNDGQNFSFYLEFGMDGFLPNAVV